METIALIAKNIVKRYSPDKGVGPVSLVLNTNHIYSVIGPNASGKTTLIRCLSEIEKLDSGTVYYTHKNSFDDHISHSVVFQQPEPWPHLNVIKNILLPLQHVLKLSESDARDRAEIEIERFGLKSHYKSHTHQLSGGLKQRVVQARAFAMKPDFLYLDEPTSALDPEWTELFGKIVKEYASENRMVLIISHQINFLRKTSDKVFYLRNGIIVESGKPGDLLDNPKDSSLIRFIENS